MAHFCHYDLPQDFRPHLYFLKRGKLSLSCLLGLPHYFCKWNESVCPALEGELPPHNPHPPPPSLSIATKECWWNCTSLSVSHSILRLIRCSANWPWLRSGYIQSERSGRKSHQNRVRCWFDKDRTTDLTLDRTRVRLVHTHRAESGQNGGVSQVLNW